MLNVNPAEIPSPYSTSGELVCNNGGALFLNNVTVSTKTISNVIAQWITPNDTTGTYLNKTKISYR